MATRTALISRGSAAACLVVAPLLEVVEAALSPLTDTSTRADLAAVATQQQLFVVSVLVGMAATVVYVPAFIGLGSACLDRSPRWARTGVWLSLGAMLGFFGVRMGQAVELQALREGLSPGVTARLMDHLATNPLGVAELVLFLGGSTFGVITLAVAAWRAGLPRPGAVLFGVFPVADLALSGHLGTVASHLLLLAGLAWLAIGLRRNHKTPDQAVAGWRAGAGSASAS